MKRPVLIALIGAGATIIGVLLTVYFSPTQTCIRAQHEMWDPSNGLSPGQAELICSKAR